MFNIIKSANAVAVADMVVLRDMSTQEHAAEEKKQQVRRMENLRQEAVDMEAELARLRILEETILKKARENAGKIMERAMQDVQKKTERVMHDAEAHAEQIRRQAYSGGWDAGIRESEAVLHQQLVQMNDALLQFRQAQGERVATLESEIGLLALEIAEKILNKRIEQDPAEMKELVHAAVAAASDKTRVTVKLPEKMPELMEALEKTLLRTKVELRTADLPVGTCRVETEDGALDASIHTQLQNLKEKFESAAL